MLSPRRESHMIEKLPSGSARRDWSTQLPSATNRSIRVIHIFAPKIIKTDVANFRALVQKLTGRTDRTASKKRSRKSRSDSSTGVSSSTVKQIVPPIRHFSHMGNTSTTRATTVPVPGSLSDSVNSAFAEPQFQFCASLQSASSCPPPHPEISGFSQLSSPKSKPSMVDPLQSLSGYKDNWSSQQASCFNFEFNLSDHHVDHSRHVCHSNFSEMDILMGLVTPGPLPEFSLPPPLNSNSNHQQQSDHFLHSNACRFSFQSLLRGSISPLGHF